MSKIIIADGSGHIDTAHETLVKFIPSEIPIVMVTWAENFQFNKELLSIKDYILIDFCEYGYDHNFNTTGTHIWGKNSNLFSRYNYNDWIKFDDWVRNNPAKLTFKRELLLRDVTEILKPIDYTTALEPIPVQSEAEFNARAISAFYYFGRSHEDRLRLHGDIWRLATPYGYSVCDNIYYFNSFMQYEAGKKYVSMHVPHYCRHPIQDILTINGMSKIGIVPFGAGQKTFRHSEVCANSVMMMWRDELAWGAEWVNGFNCFKCEPGEEVKLIEELTKPENNLYQVYLNGVETWKKYQTKEYINNYILPLINNAKH